MDHPKVFGFLKIALMGNQTTNNFSRRQKYLQTDALPTVPYRPLGQTKYIVWFSGPADCFFLEAKRLFLFENLKRHVFFVFVCFGNKKNSEGNLWSFKKTKGFERILRCFFFLSWQQKHPLRRL